MSNSKLSTEQLNNVFANLSRFGGYHPPSSMIKEEVVREVNGEGAQGEEGETIRIFDVLSDGFFLKVNIGTDSYGDNRFIRNIQIVKAKKKTIEVYDFDSLTDNEELS